MPKIKKRQNKLKIFYKKEKVISKQVLGIINKLLSEGQH